MNDADTTWALVIGIDVYDNVTPLAGAVLDAIEVVGWLRQLGVKDDRILLHASPCTAALAPLKALGIQPRGCTEPEIWTSLSTLLDNNGSRLFVFLLGHGFYLLDGGCVFLTKEADHNALTNYGIDWLADLLRGRKYDRQFIVMDGCLNYAYPPSDRPTVEPGRHPGAKVGAPLEGVSQWFARGASQGETAAEPNRRGLFTAKLLETLNLTSPNPRCVVINDTTGEYEIDLYTAVTSIVSPSVSNIIPMQHPGIKRLDEGPANGEAIVAAVAPKGTVTLRTRVDPACAVVDIDSVTLQSRQYLWRRTVPAVTDTSLKLPFTTILPIDMNLIGWCDLKPSTDWRDPDPFKRTTGDGRDIVFTLEKKWSSQTLKVTTIDRDNVVVAAMTPDAVNAASDVIAAEDAQDTVWLSPSPTGAVLRTQVGDEQLLPAISQRIADAIDTNTPREVHTSIEFPHQPRPQPRRQGWTLNIDLDLTHADALGGFAANRDDVRIDGVSMSLHQLANRRQVTINGLGPALVELNLPWGRWTTIVEPPDDPTKSQPTLEFPETVGLPPIRNTLRDTVLKPGSHTAEAIAAGRPAFALAVTSDEQLEVFAAPSAVAKQILEGASPTDGWTALEDHGERLGAVTVYEKNPKYWPIGRLAAPSNSSSLYFPMYIPNLAFDNRIAPRVEPLSIDPSPLWDLLVSAGRLHSLTEDSAWKVLKKNANNPTLTLAASYASYINGFTEPLEKLLESWIRAAKDGETASDVPDVVILWHAYAMKASASQTRAHPVLSRPNPQRLQELAARGRVPMLRWGVSIGQSVAEHYDIPELATALAHIEDRLETTSTWTLWHDEGGNGSAARPATAEPDEVSEALASAEESQPTYLSNRPHNTTAGEPTEVNLNRRYTFDNFVIGASNRFAHAAMVAIAETPARAYNPLFIWGERGLGKTHLLHAAGNYVQRLFPGIRVKYVSIEEFTNDLINAVSDDRKASFKRSYLDIDVLLVDDIQFIESKESIQEEFFDTVNTLHNANKQIVISSDRPPNQLAPLNDRLRAQFEKGLITDVQPPDLETRIAILRKKAQMDRLDVPVDVLELIASSIERNIRELEGAMIRVIAFASLNKTPIDKSLAESVLRDL